MISYTQTYTHTHVIAIDFVFYSLVIIVVFVVVVDDVLSFISVFDSDHINRCSDVSFLFTSTIYCCTLFVWRVNAVLAGYICFVVHILPICLTSFIIFYFVNFRAFSTAFSVWHLRVFTSDFFPRCYLILFLVLFLNFFMLNSLSFYILNAFFLFFSVCSLLFLSLPISVFACIEIVGCVV